jgi:PKD domain/Regulator of chromosome condensation (RCC1) repeat
MGSQWSRNPAFILAMSLMAVPLFPSSAAASTTDDTEIVSAGAIHTCGVKTDTTVTCWGSGGNGQTSPPVGTFASVSAGGLHTCGLRTDSTVACWGGSSFFGEGRPPAGNFVSVSAGDFHTCGVKSDFTLACWGANVFGEGSPPAGTFASVSAGFDHTCGVKADSTVACWGRNFFGQASPPAGTFLSVSAGDWHTCGLKTDSTVACWGYNFYGQSSPPAGTFASVNVGLFHTCGVKTDSTVACWGYNFYGQSSPPAGTFASVATGNWHTCGLKTDSRVVCWGDHGFGQSNAPAVTTFGPITNTPPTVSAGSDVSGAEGAGLALDGAVTDPDAGDTLAAAWTYTAVTGTGTCSFADASATYTTITCTDDGTYTATLTANDGVNPAVSESAGVTVANAAPVAAITTPSVDSLHAVGTVNLSASFSDVGTGDTQTCSIDWNDGSSSGPFLPISGECASSHAYTAAGLYTIAVTVSDDDAGSDTETVGIVVYDPSGGFVTGGGWIDSPAGAYLPDPTVVGKATFGFVSKYQKGATVPSGQTEFKFEAAGLKFHSSSYDWLVISGPKARYKGEGTVNGAGGYGFMLTATDGQVTGGNDKFRIRIWDKATDEVIYDNQLGDNNDADAATGLGGGQIMIHKK